MIFLTRTLLTKVLLLSHLLSSISSTSSNSHDSADKCDKGIDEKSLIINAIISSTPESIDPDILTKVYQELKNRNAHKCWHKHSTFLEHLSGVHNMLRLWGQGRDLSLVGLLHSAYSNSYVNLALFDPETERHVMQQLIGIDAEQNVFQFCSINRQDIVVNTLLKQGYIPKDGLHVPHLRDKTKQVYLSAEVLRQLVIFTMADIADQYFGWQDELFGMGMLLPDDPEAVMNSKALWPGVSKPGLWVAYVSELGKVAKSYYTLNNDSNITTITTPLLPPIFQNCSKTLSRNDEKKARDLYWKVITESITDTNEIILVLEECIQLNPYVAEPSVILAQAYLHEGNNLEKAKYYIQNAIQLFESWGTVWDKRMSYGAWLAWSKVMLLKATEGISWPESSWEVNNWGLVSE